MAILSKFTVLCLSSYFVANYICVYLLILLLIIFCVYLLILLLIIFYLELMFFYNKVVHQLYGHLPPITKTIQVRRTRHAGPCWRSKDELISDVLLWTPTYRCAKAGRPARTYIQQLCEDTGCNPEDLPEAINDWEKWRERVRDIHAGGTTWWWWWWLF